jgi:5-methyltetrahydropteroyltriglutamate--homocysteine methyltransferase
MHQACAELGRSRIHVIFLAAKENVIAGTDCGFAQGSFIQRVHPEIQWAKLAALAEGARLASRELWGAAAA